MKYIARKQQKVTFENGLKNKKALENILLVQKSTLLENTNVYK